MTERTDLGLVSGEPATNEYLPRHDLERRDNFTMTTSITFEDLIRAHDQRIHQLRREWAPTAKVLAAQL